MIARRLRLLIDKFVKENPQYSTQEGAQYQCCDASDKFVQFVKREDVTALNDFQIRLFEFSVRDSTGMQPRYYIMGTNETGRDRADWHCIVNTKNVLLDFTAKQYVQAAPYPLVIVKRHLQIQPASLDNSTRYHRVLRPSVVARMLLKKMKQDDKAKAATAGA